MESFKNSSNKISNLEKRKNVKLITACIIERRSFSSDTEKNIKQIKKTGIDIDYFANELFYKKNNMRSAGTQTYVISDINSSNKYSLRYQNCTGIILVGKNKEGKELSFMTHQDPGVFLHLKKDQFTTDLSEKVKEILKNVEKNTLDAIVFGGNDLNPNFKQYKDSIFLINKILEKELGFTPTVMTGPNLSEADTDVFFDTQNRRLFVVRQSHPSTVNENYSPTELEEQSKKWKHKL